MKENLVSLDSVDFSYVKQERILKSLSLSCPMGNIIGLLGENGAGKTTLFDIITGSLPIDDGIIRHGIEIEQILYVQQVIYTPPALKIREVVEMIACFQGVSRRETKDLIEMHWSDAMLSRYRKIENRRTGLCSYGEKRWVIICAALTLSVEKYLFILDEPTAGIDVQHRHLVWELIRKMKSDNRSFIISSHLIDEIGKNTDYFYFLNNLCAEKFLDMKEFMHKYNADSAEDAFLNATLNC